MALFSILLKPRFDEFEAAGIMDRSVYAEAGRHGFVGFNIPTAYGGGGATDFRFNAVVNEELSVAGMGGAGNGIILVNDITNPYFVQYCNAAQAQRWLPGIAAGELITAVAMTEPGTGSDLAGIRSRAVADDDAWILNGAKTFITNGINSDLVIVVCRTDPSAGRAGLSLLVVERGMNGFTKGRNLQKIGQHGADTAELFFDDVRVPRANVLGEEGRALDYLAANLAQERLSMGITGLAVSAAALEWTVAYATERRAFGQPIASFQNSKFVLADVATEIAVTRPFIEQCIARHNDGQLGAADAAMAKLWATELQVRTTNRCLQLFGGYGYTTEYPIGPAFVDARVATIYGGTSEIMRTIIAKEVLGGHTTRT